LRIWFLDKAQWKRAKITENNLMNEILLRYATVTKKQKQKNHPVNAASRNNQCLRNPQTLDKTPISSVTVSGM
jgi:hypothetical protein